AVDGHRGGVPRLLGLLARGLLEERSDRVGWLTSRGDDHDDLPRHERVTVPLAQVPRKTAAKHGSKADHEPAPTFERQPRAAARHELGAVPILGDYRDVLLADPRLTKQRHR